MPKKNNILDSLNQMKEKDVYSLLLFLLYRLSEDEHYSTLSALIWALDKESLLNFLALFGGVTLKVPTIRELKILVSAMQLYQEVNLENKSLEMALLDIKLLEFTEQELKDTYYRISDIMASGEVPNV